MSVRPTPPPETALRTLHLVCGALMASVVAYGVVGWTLTRGQEAKPASMLPWLLLAAGFVVQAVGEVLRRLMLAATSAPRTAMTFFTAHLVTFALFEGGALMGLVAAFVGGGLLPLGLLAPATFILMAWRFPRRDTLDDYLRGRS